MAIPPNSTLGSLGGPNTFGGDAARRLRELYPEFTSTIYFPTAEEGMSFADGRTLAMCVPQQMKNTGAHVRMQTRIATPGSNFYVIAEVTHEYHCCLLVKPGTKLSQIKRVLGHTGSITQSRPWLEINVPQAKIEIVETHSMGAAQSVATGDGTIASVGTPGMGKEFGLEYAATEIDNGSVGAYWALSPRPLFSENPTRLVVSGRIGDDGVLSELVTALLRAGYGLQTIFAQASGRHLFEYDYVMRFAGKGALDAVKSAVAAFSAVRLAGAFEARE
jgi:chorismate mutase / prephenate dehydratase